MTFARPINTKGKPANISQGFRNTHRGIDYAYRNGTPVYASQSGEVYVAINAYTDSWIAGNRPLTTRDYGNYIMIDHGKGFATLYAHLRPDSLKVNPGQVVKQGQQIAEVGSTGNSTGNHIHWETRLHNRTFDPSTRFDSTFTNYTTGGGDNDMAKTMEIKRETFEELVGKASKYDAFFNAGYSDIRVVSRKINERDENLVRVRRERDDYKHEILDSRQLIEDYQKEVEELRDQLAAASIVETQVPGEATTQDTPPEQQKATGKKLNKTLSGYKTYVATAAGVVVAGLYSQGIIDTEMFAAIEALLGFLGIGTLRLGVKKAEKQGK